jgi:hypothetical protein
MPLSKRFRNGEARTRQQWISAFQTMASFQGFDCESLTDVGMVPSVPEISKNYNKITAPEPLSSSSGQLTLHIVANVKMLEGRRLSEARNCSTLDPGYTGPVANGPQVGIQVRQRNSSSAR